MYTDSVYAVACSPVDSDLVATGGGDDKAYIWRIRDNVPPLELTSRICRVTLKNSEITLNFSLFAQVPMVNSETVTICAI